MSEPEALTGKSQQVGCVLPQAQGSSSAEQEKNHYALWTSQVVLEKPYSLLSQLLHK